MGKIEIHAVASDLVRSVPVFEKGNRIQTLEFVTKRRTHLSNKIHRYADFLEPKEYASVPKWNALSKTQPGMVLKRKYETMINAAEYMRVKADAFYDRRRSLSLSRTHAQPHEHLYNFSHISVSKPKKWKNGDSRNEKNRPLHLIDCGDNTEHEKSSKHTSCDVLSQQSDSSGTL